MSALLHPGLGDYLDRWTILELKITHGESFGRDCAHFHAEQRALRLHPGLDAAIETPEGRRLFTINAAIWTHTDYLLQALPAWPNVREEDIYAIADKAIQILKLNEARARLVQQLNGGPAEKLR